MKYSDCTNILTIMDIINLVRPSLGNPNQQPNGYLRWGLSVIQTKKINRLHSEYSNATCKCFYDTHLLKYTAYKVPHALVFNAYTSGLIITFFIDLFIPVVSLLLEMENRFQGPSVCSRKTPIKLGKSYGPYHFGQ